MCITSVETWYLFYTISFRENTFGNDPWLFKSLTVAIHPSGNFPMTFRSTHKLVYMNKSMRKFPKCTKLWNTYLTFISLFNITKIMRGNMPKVPEEYSCNMGVQISGNMGQYAWEISGAASDRSISMKLCEIVVLHRGHLVPKGFLKIYKIMGVIETFFVILTRRKSRENSKKFWIQFVVTVAPFYILLVKIYKSLF